MSLVRRLLPLIFPLLTVSYSSAQPAEVYFDHLTMKDGLSMNPVMAIVQDKQGYLWFATQDGLNRYDGYSFSVFRSEEGDSTTLSDNFITSLALDPSGDLWIGTLSGGVNRYSLTTGKFIRYNNLPSERIWCLFMDENGILWIGTENGPYWIDSRTGKKAVPPELFHQSQINDLPVTMISKTSDGTIWIGTTSGIFSFADEKVNVYRNRANDPSSISNDIILSMLEDKNKQIWIGTLDGFNKMLPGGRFERIRFKDEQQSMFRTDGMKKNIYSIINNYNGNTIRTIWQDMVTGLHWIGTDMELIIYNPRDNKFKNYRKDLINPFGINDHFIRSMYCDRSGNLWIGTLGNGLNKVNLKPDKFRKYSKKLNDANSLSANYVRAICEDEKGRIWVGSLIGGLDRFDPSSEKFYNIPSNKKAGFSLNDNNVWSLEYDDLRNILWVGTNNGLNGYDPETGAVIYYRHDVMDLYSLSENTIRSIYVDTKHRVWVGTEGGLNLLDPEKKIFKRFTHNPNDISSISNNTIWKIKEATNGKLWLATNDGLNLFDPSSGKSICFKKEDNNRSSISHNGIRSLLIASDGTLWVGTQNGLNKFISKDSSFIRYDQNDGLPNSFIYSIEEDTSGKIWISTNKGIASMEKDGKNLSVFDIYDGLQDYEFNTNASYRTKAGTMYFGGPGGLNYFDPLNIPYNRALPETEITGIKINGKIWKGDVDISQLEKLVLNYDQNILQFEFSAFDFTRPERNRYMYIMEGFNSDWIDAGNIRFTTYTNLDPGEYVFRVKGTNSDGFWSNKTDSILITVLPPFWKTKWFYGLCITCILLIIYFIYRWRVKLLTSEKRKLEKKVQERTLDLEEEKRKIETINKELEKLSIVARETDNAVVIADAGGKIEWINEGFIRMYSVNDHNDYYGKSLQDTTSNPGLPEFISRSVKEKRSMIYESVNYHPDGSGFYVQSTLTPIFNGSGEVTKLVVIDTDITERKRAEEIIKAKNKDITDSISYGVRIQRALLPDQQHTGKLLKDHFILFIPKDIVSGDFYFSEIIRTNEGDELTGFAVGDCTGHGVPGAFMSIIGMNYLKQSLTEKTVNTPGEALAFLSGRIKAVLGRKDEFGAIRDGMDIAFCVYDPRSSKIFFSGANRPLIIVRDKKVIEVSGDKNPIGYGSDTETYTNHPVDVLSGDMIYLFSDGYPDQFGGPSGKKFKYKKLIQLFEEISDLPTQKQKNIMEETFTSWKGKLEQVDDVCVLGMRI